MSGKSVTVLEELQNSVREVIALINTLPFSEDAKKEIIRLVEIHANTSFETLKRVYDR